MWPKHWTLQLKCCVMALAAVALTGQAQAKEQQLNLDDVLKIASAGSFDRNIITQTFEANDAQVDSFRSGVMPLITTQIGANYLSTSLVDSNFGGGFGGSGGSQGGSQQGMSLLQEQEQQSFPKRADGSNSTFGLNFITPAYSFGRFGAVYTIAGLQTKLLDVQKDSELQNYYLRVITAYNEALLSLNLSNVAKRSVDHAKQVESFTKLEYETGGRSRVDYLRARSFRALAEADAEQARSRSDAALARLKILVGMAPEQSLALKAGAADNTLLGTGELKAAPQRALKAMRLQKDIATNMAEYRQAQHWPTIYLVANANSSLTKLNADGFEYNEDKELQDGFAADRMNYSVGLQFQWTLFDGFRTSAEARRTRAEAIVAENQLAKMEREDSIAKTEATNQLKVSKIAYDATVEAREAADLAFKQADSDFQAGTASLTDVLEAQKELSEAQRREAESHALRIVAAANYRIVNGQDLFREATP